MAYLSDRDRRLYGVKYYQEHREERIAYSRRWKANNLARYREYHKHYVRHKRGERRLWAALDALKQIYDTWILREINEIS